MKKRLLALALTVCSVSLLAACDTDDDNQQAQTKTEQTTNSQADQSDSSQTKISADKAKAIALKDAGFAEKDVTLLSVEQDTDDGLAEFEIEFTKDTREYSYTINADTGDIISKESENVND
ncbi:PepSY domain-containing protein [Streptococcus devriesei]|uniref:PepSY domain-containing protein n=1 Tax=Streptococcus devriesei TaxID=231233 RepID=UPI0004023BDF|nr:PepSY domain-containing protein [Streptococcus devriesei]